MPSTKPNKFVKTHTKIHKKKKKTKQKKQNPTKTKYCIPALIPEAPAFFNPFFLTMKLAPMKKLEDSARTKPLMLSADMPL